MDKPLQLSLSHLELRFADMASAERFYVDVLGFKVTDRSRQEGGMVFLSMSQDEHHQIVLCPGRAPGRPSVLDHIALRAGSLAQLRCFYRSLVNRPEVDMQTVSHGNSWSLYLHDPEGNRIELFVDTPWHVDQPVRFAIDFTLTDDELLARTEAAIRDMPGFRRLDEWQGRHKERFHPA